MTLGTLRDQVVYPHTVKDLKRAGITDDELGKYLDLVQLRYILDREGGWDSVQDWMDVLSGGEKQRIAVNAWLTERMRACADGASVLSPAAVCHSR
jgi:ATP-binding cassette subfamily D (ALD) protein 3